MKIVIIDNYDSFTFNLYQYVAEFEPDTQVFRNDKIKVEEVAALQPDRIIISPGPGHPNDPAYFGICNALIRQFSATIPILGVCLGHQGIANVYGASIVVADQVMHGKTSIVYHHSDPIFDGVPNGFEVMRYHSLVVDPSTLPEAFQVIAHTKDQVIMGIKHTAMPLYGLQFHPESIGTPHGKQILRNFLYLG
ncbi:MAG TPA: aminodeoxychorismate/anthranilate synthase component II [Saprospiraceae bacterium]|nr:aminodeoxychorismate/anthranilate synthase component II [Saprospiraceae bacterium]HMQ81657.1 aminodeoxychorismate/anthranilate synthase component II [Saprospiraceae bacterium]